MKRILLTWASSGLGFELAKLFHEKWFEVIALGRHKPEIDIQYISLDLTSGESIQQAVQHIKSEYSTFDCLLHCAGDGKVECIDDINFSDADSTFRLNVVWPLALTAWLFDLIKKNEADVLSIVATIGLKWYQHMTTYSAAKRGQTGFVENLQLELKWTKSRVISVYPWGMQTESNVGEQRRDTQLRKITGKSSSGSMLDPKEIAKIVFDIYSLPKNIEVSEIIINRK